MQMEARATPSVMMVNTVLLLLNEVDTQDGQSMGRENDENQQKDGRRV